MMTLDLSPKTALILIDRFNELGKPGAFQYAFPVLHHQRRGPLGSHHNNGILPAHVVYLQQHESYQGSGNLLVCKRLVQLETLVDEWFVHEAVAEPINGMRYQQLCHEAVSRQVLEDSASVSQ